MRSDPLVLSYEPGVICNLCDVEGHSHLSCPLASHKVGCDMSYEDYVFWCYVSPIDRPEEFIE